MEHWNIKLINFASNQLLINPLVRQNGKPVAVFAHFDEKMFEKL